MKNKILSIALVLGMLLSIIGDIPVSAAGEAYTRSFPYAFFDYEDGVINMQGATIVDGGMAGSGKCIQYTSSADGVNHDDKGIYLGGNGENVVGDVPANNTFKISFYVKVTQQLTKGNFVLFINYKNKNGVSGSTTPLKTFDPTKVNEWQKVEFEYTTTEDITITSLRMRYGGHGAHLENGNFVVGESTSVPRTYYFDDMEMTVTSPFQTIPGSGSSDGGSAPVVPTKMTLENYYMDFENGSSVIASNSNASITTTGITNSKGSMQIIQDPNNAENTILKVTHASATAGDEASVNFGLGEAVSSTTRAKGVIPAGGTITYTFDYYLPQAVKSSLDNLKNHPAMIISHYPGSCFAVVTGPMGTAANEWHTATFKYTNNGSSDLEVGAYQFRLCGTYNTYAQGATPASTTWTVANHTGSGYGDRTFYFDNIRVSITGPEGAPSAEEANLSLNDYSMNFEEGSTIQVAGKNVTDAEDGTADEMAVITADPANAENKALKLTTTFDYDALDSTIKFSGAAGANINSTTDKITAPGSIPAGGKITYKFKYYLASEVAAEIAPEFSVKHVTGNVTATSNTAFATTAGVWHEAKLTYTNNKTTAVSVDNAILRLCGDDATTQWKADGTDMVIYFDDFAVETAEAAFPTSAGLRFNGSFVAGEEVTFYHTYTATEDGAEDKSIVRFLSTVDGVTGSLGSCLMGTKFIVPEVPEDAELSFEVVPVDSGILGVKIPYSYASVVGQYATLSISDFAADGSVTASAMVENRRFDLTDINAVLIVVMYNEKGGIVKYEQVPVACVNDDEETVTHVLTAPTGVEVKKASAFLWYCKDASEHSFTNTTMVELVADKTVSK